MLGREVGFPGNDGSGSSEAEQIYTIGVSDSRYDVSKEHRRGRKESQKEADDGTNESDSGFPELDLDIEVIADHQRYFMYKLIGI